MDRTVGAVDTEKLCSGDRRALAKAITLVESRLPADQTRAHQLIEALSQRGCWSRDRSIRLGVSGAPGVGKSTFIEAFGGAITASGRKVAVLAVDPSSPISGGSILGDKTRMEQLSRDPNAFIRPSPSSGELGGVTQATRAAILLCEAAHYDVVVVETVGAGQSEVDVANMTDFFAVLMQPYGGDGLQGIKKGILEMADFVLINKADGDLIDAARRACQEYESALHLSHTLVQRQGGASEKQVLCCSSLTGEGIEAVVEAIQMRWRHEQAHGTLTERRRRQSVRWMERLIVEQLPWRLQQSPLLSNTLRQLKQALEQGSITVEASVEQFYDQLLSESNMKS